MASTRSHAVVRHCPGGAHFTQPAHRVGAPLNTKALELLEFTKVRERVAGHTSFSAGRELVASLAPAADYETAVRGQQETAEARALLELRPNFALGGVHDVRPLAVQAALGGLLIPAQLQEIRDTLAGGRSARRVVELAAEQLPTLWEALETIPDCRDVERGVEECIGPRGEVVDDASPTLARLRRDVRRTHDTLTGRLQDLLSSARGRTLLQEPLITLRNGRYVVPVKAEFRGEFKGLVHDVSSSGATMFMEPLDMVDLGNRWRELQIEEEREVERVLRRLSDLVGDYRAEIDRTVAVLAALDCNLAKAHYAAALAAVRPQLQRGHEGQRALNLVQARHPLLTGHVVPISLTLGDDCTTLVITGPNTGGKTVALKTVGLLTLMALAGLQTPAAAGTTVPVYREVFADIGDEQSIEQSLSTFSSHMRNIINIIGQATDDCLVLLDELGAGTDPTEGSALARALLSFLPERGVTTVATTHHSDLKAFAHTTPGVRNASVEFDEETLSPTYRLEIGVPGRSNAIAIAQRLGLPEALVGRARGLLHPQELRVDHLIASLQRERAAAEAERADTQKERNRATVARQRVEEQLRALEREREEHREAARQELAGEVDALRAEIRQAEQEIDRARREQQRESLLAAAQTAQQTEAQLAQPEWQPKPRRRSRRAARPMRWRPGMKAQHQRLGQVVEVMSEPSPEGEVEVQMGSFRARVKVEELSPAGRAAPAPAERAPAAWSYTPGPAVSVATELHLRGLRVEEALEQLQDYIDNAFRAGMPWVRIIHGHGTGAMRRAVREALSGHPLVRALESPPQEQGGAGVTVATLAL